MSRFSPYNRTVLAKPILSILTLFLVCQFASAVGQREVYNVQCTFPKAYISGICIINHDDGDLKGAIVNEFGISALSFVYNPRKHKVKIVSSVKQLKRWYIRRVLRHDLREILHMLPTSDGVCTYENHKYQITYIFSPIQDDTSE